MKTADIKVGETYGVRLHQGKNATVVAAKVIALDVPYTYTSRGVSGHEYEVPNGGVLVEFVNPTRLGYGDFWPDRGQDVPLLTEYTFGDRKNRGKVGAFFVDRWETLEEQRLAGERAQAEYAARRAAEVAAFAPVLDEFIEKLGRHGLNVTKLGDHSGLSGDVNMRLNGGGYSSDGPTGMAGHITVPREWLEKLLDKIEVVS